MDVDEIGPYIHIQRDNLREKMKPPGVGRAGDLLSTVKDVTIGLGVN
jgi:hypothetical protein